MALAPDTPSLEQIRRAPKVLLHDHLDGGLRDGIVYEEVRFAPEPPPCPRLGHGVRLVDGISVDGDRRAALGRLASYARDRRAPLELCPTSNVMKSAFWPFEQRLRIIDEQIKPGYATLRASVL